MKEPTNVVYLSRRNLLTLLSKLDRAAKGEATHKAIIKNDLTHDKYPCRTVTTVFAVEDDDYYKDRPPGPTQELHRYIPWLQVMDEALVLSHLGVAESTDSYEVAKAKLEALINLEIIVATDSVFDGPDVVDGCDVEGFPGGCERHHPGVPHDVYEKESMEIMMRNLKNESHESVIEDAYKDHTS